MRIRPDLLFSPLIAKTFNMEYAINNILQNINRNSDNKLFRINNTAILSKLIAVPFCMNFGLTRIQRKDILNIFRMNLISEPHSTFENHQDSLNEVISNEIYDVFGINDQISLGSSRSMDIMPIHLTWLLIFLRCHHSC